MGFIDSPAIVSGYDVAMKSKPKPDQYKTFESALKGVLRVSHADMQERIAAEKKKPSKKRASGRVSDRKD
ncbi:MAG: hypothetical protein JWO20_1116 [Candidatus Angelobacter sp.]|nr:hypothetical protein [Candidatus Angelobacter sp.]